METSFVSTQINWQYVNIKSTNLGFQNKQILKTHEIDIFPFLFYFLVNIEVVYYNMDKIFHYILQKLHNNYIFFDQCVSTNLIWFLSLVLFTFSYTISHVINMILLKDKSMIALHSVLSFFKVKLILD